MNRRRFLALLGLVPVAIKAAVTKPVEQKPNLGHWMSDGTGFNSMNLHPDALTWEKLNAIYEKEIVKRLSETNPYADLFESKPYRS